MGTPYRISARLHDRIPHSAKHMYIGVFSVGPSFNIHDFSSMKQNVPDIRTKVPSDRTMHRCALAPGEPFHCSCCTRQINRLPKSSKKTPMELAKNSLLDISRSDCEAQKAVTKPQMLPSRTALTHVIVNWGFYSALTTVSSESATVASQP